MTDAPSPGRVRRRILAVVGAVGLALGALELALRVVERYEPEPIWYVGELENQPSENFAIDSETGWRMRPDHRFTRPAAGVEIEYLSDGEGLRRSATPRPAVWSLAGTGPSRRSR